MDALFWAIPAAIALGLLALRTPRVASTALSATACLWIATLAVIIARS